MSKRTVLAFLVVGSVLPVVPRAAVAGTPQEIAALKAVVESQGAQIAALTTSVAALTTNVATLSATVAGLTTNVSALTTDLASLTAQVSSLTDQLNSLATQFDGLANRVGGYTIRGQWYQGEGGGFTRYFEAGDALLTIPELPPGDYLLTAYVAAMPLNQDYDALIKCSVGRLGAPVGSGETRWVTMYDKTSTVTVIALGTHQATDAFPTADLRCYAPGTLAVAQASLTAIPLRNLAQVPPVTP